MRLIEHVNGKRPKFTRYLDENLPRYAILSHTWEEGQEITHDDFCIGRNKTRQKRGWIKIDFCLQMSNQHQLSYFWIDSCCIDKRNEFEYNEIITSMFSWYAKSDVCLVYLSDVSTFADFRNARWWTRGWTLQELLAPENVEFYSKHMTYLGTKRDLVDEIHDFTGIPVEALLGEPLSNFTISERISWMKGRYFTDPRDYDLALRAILGADYARRYGQVQRQRILQHEKTVNELNEKNQTEQSDRAYNLSVSGSIEGDMCSLKTDQYEWDYLYPEVTLDDILRSDAFEEPDYHDHTGDYTPNLLEDHYDWHRSHVSSSHTSGLLDEDTREDAHPQSGGGPIANGGPHESCGDSDGIQYQLVRDEITDHDSVLITAPDNMNFGCCYSGQDCIPHHAGYSHLEDQLPAESHNRGMKKGNHGKGKHRDKRDKRDPRRR